MALGQQICTTSAYNRWHSAIMRADRYVKSTRKHGYACLTLPVFPTTLFCRHNRAARNSASESVHARTERQTKQQVISGRKQFEYSRGTERHGKGMNLIGSATPSTTTLYTRSRNVPCVPEFCWPGVWSFGIWNLGVWSSGVKSGGLAGISSWRTPGTYCSYSLDSVDHVGSSKTTL